jgi:hypothetical protein
MRTLTTTLTYHARERLLERTKLTEVELLSAVRGGKTTAIGLSPGGRVELRLVYSVADANYFVLPLDIARNRVRTILPLAMYLNQRRAFAIPECHFFDAKSKFIEPLHEAHPSSGQAIRLHATGYFLSSSGDLTALSLGNHGCPPGITCLVELANDAAFMETLVGRVRARGLNPARLDALYVRQGKRDPVALAGVGPANPWATVGLFDVPGPAD